MAVDKGLVMRGGEKKRRGKLGKEEGSKGVRETMESKVVCVCTHASTHMHGVCTYAHGCVHTV